jgi:hypothetical protein
MFDLDKLKMIAHRRKYIRSQAPANGSFMSFNFGQQNIGDCTIHDGNVFRYIDYGQSDWVTDVSSTDSGDEMNITFIGVNAAFTEGDLATGKNVMFTCYGYYFDIHDANSVKHWAETGPNIWFPAGMDAPTAWANLAAVLLDCSC